MLSSTLARQFADSNQNYLHKHHVPSYIPSDTRRVSSAQAPCCNLTLTHIWPRQQNHGSKLTHNHQDSQVYRNLRIHPVRGQHSRLRQCSAPTAAKNRAQPLCAGLQSLRPVPAPQDCESWAMYSGSEFTPRDTPRPKLVDLYQFGCEKFGVWMCEAAGLSSGALDRGDDCDGRGGEYCGYLV